MSDPISHRQLLFHSRLSRRMNPTKHSMLSRPCLSNYKTAELEQILELPSNYDESIIEMKETKLRQNILNDKSVPQNIKTNTPIESETPIVETETPIIHDLPSQYEIIDKETNIEKIQKKLHEYNLPMFYWTKSVDAGLEFNPALDMRHINTRIQLYIKTKAKFNVGNQTGVNDTISNYTPTFTIARPNLGSNIIRSQFYL